MRIISGKFKGRSLEGFLIDGTRPTMDRVKESLFSMIQNKISESICLDLFAGSGSLGIEAISNGASKCYFVDNNKEVIKVLKRNLSGIENFEILNMDYLSALDNLKNKKFDIVFLDPPYDMHIINKSIERIIELDLLNEDAIIVCESETENVNCILELIKEKKYGKKSVKIYRNR